LETPTTVGPSTSGCTPITIHPLKPDDSEYITEAEIFLRKVCHRQNVKRSETSMGEVAWIVTLTDRELLPILYESPWFELELTAKKTLRRFIRRNEDDPNADPYYTIHAKDYKNDVETKATEAFLRTKVTDPNQPLHASTYPFSYLIFSWCNVQLSDAAKEEVEAYMGRQHRPYEPHWPMYDDSKVPVIEDSDWK
jgi:hypothetical protein